MGEGEPASKRVMRAVAQSVEQMVASEVASYMGTRRFVAYRQLPEYLGVDPEEREYEWERVFEFSRHENVGRHGSWPHVRGNGTIHVCSAVRRRCAPIWPLVAGWSSRMTGITSRSTSLMPHSA
jgi:hypothetical protein